jgi:RimJ/RimL family protein N-acetyltransferase
LIEAKGGICIDTQRLLIRRFSPDDWRDLHEYLSQPEVVQFEPYDIFAEAASQREAARRAGDPAFWAVCLRDGGKLIGNIYLSKQEYDTWELGYVFNKRYHGMGYATEAARALLENVFTNQNARRVVAMCNPLNAPSWRLLERLGFRREGHFIRNIYFKKDAAGEPIWCDTYAYGILKEEWNSRYPHEH